MKSNEIISKGLNDLVIANAGKLCVIDDKNPNKELSFVQVRDEDAWIARAHCLKLGSFDDKFDELCVKRENVSKQILDLEAKRPGPLAHWHMVDPEMERMAIDKKIAPLQNQLAVMDEIIGQIGNGTYQMPMYKVPVNYRV